MVPQSSHTERLGSLLDLLFKARRWVGLRAGIPQSWQEVVEGTGNT